MSNNSSEYISSILSKDLYIDLLEWQIHVHCHQPEVISSIQQLFNYRGRAFPWEIDKRLICEVVSDYNQFDGLRRRIAFDGPTINIRPEVTIAYAFEGSHIWICVPNTAIIELDEASPHYSRIYLDDSSSPCLQSGHAMQRIRAEPEGFFYPLVVEWIRQFNACLIHCGAVAIGNKAVILSGPPNSGKSTQVLRLVLRGARFLADDLAILHNSDRGLKMMAFREVANVNRQTLERFSELHHLEKAPLRSDGKYCIDIQTYFGQSACREAYPGLVIHLHPDSKPWIEPCPPENILDNIHSMAWFFSKRDLTERHFWLLTDWLLASSHLNVSQGYLASYPEEFISRIRKEIDFE
ncbi:MAG: hypothetical protein ACETWK_03680 [Candidatus Aminicenantaceae bacterium]